MPGTPIPILWPLRTARHRGQLRVPPRPPLTAPLTPGGPWGGSGGRLRPNAVTRTGGAPGGFHGVGVTWKGGTGQSMGEWEWEAASFFFCPSYKSFFFFLNLLRLFFTFSSFNLFLFFFVNLFFFSPLVFPFIFIMIWLKSFSLSLPSASSPLLPPGTPRPSYPHPPPPLLGSRFPVLLPRHGYPPPPLPPPRTHPPAGGGRCGGAVPARCRSPRPSVPVPLPVALSRHRRRFRPGCGCPTRTRARPHVPPPSPRPLRSHWPSHPW